MSPRRGPLVGIVGLLAIVVLAVAPTSGPTLVASQGRSSAQTGVIVPLRASDPLPWETTTTTVPPTTTTTRPPESAAPTTTIPAPPPSPAQATADSTGQVNGYPCGGDLPPCWVLARESGGNPTAVNPTGCGGYTCGGLWQFDPRTWAGFGGYAFAQDAPPDVQNAKARALWAGGAGCFHWAAC